MDADNHFEIFSLASFGPSLGVMTSTAWEPPTGEDWPLVVELIDRRIQMMGGGRAETALHGGSRAVPSPEEE